MVNVHASLLPRYRGAAPVHRAVIAGDSQTGVTIMRVVKALDAGPMLATVRRSIDPDETSEDVERDLAQLGADLLVSTLDRLAAGTDRTKTPQDDARGDLRAAADQGRWAGRLVAVGRRDSQPDSRSASLAARVHVLGRSPAHSAPLQPVEWNDPRTARAWSSPRTATSCASRRAMAIVQILELQAEGKRPMTAREFLAGHHIERRATVSARIHDCAGPPGRLRDPVCASRPAAPISPPRSPTRANRSATSATARSPLKSRPASSASERRSITSSRTSRSGRSARLDPEVVEILRLSAYQLLHLSRVPASAVVDDAVKLTGKVGKRSASGLVNAVLRALSRNRTALAVAGEAGGRVRSRARARLSEHHALASAMAGRALARSARAARAPKPGCSSTTERRRSRCGPTRCGRRVSDVQQQLAADDVVTPSRPICARRAHRRRGSSAARARCATPACSSCRTRRRSSSRCWPASVPVALVLDACASPGGKDDGPCGRDARRGTGRRLRRSRSPDGAAPPDRSGGRRDECPPRSGRHPRGAALSRSGSRR